MTNDSWRDFQLVDKFLEQQGLEPLCGCSIYDFECLAGVYLIWDPSEELIYIGQSSNVSRRLRTHNSYWKGVIHCPMEYDVAVAPISDLLTRQSIEMELIALLKPRHNRYGNPDYTG